MALSRSRIVISSDGSIRTLHLLVSSTTRSDSPSLFASDQRVKIDSTSQTVRIVGITPDHGLLRTVAVDVDRNGNEVFGGGMGSRTYVDLQPDGNGFDMTKGLLVSRDT